MLRPFTQTHVNEQVHAFTPFNKNQVDAHNSLLSIFPDFIHFAATHP